VGNLKGKDNLQDPGVDGSIGSNMKQNLKVWVGMVKTVLIWNIVRNK
jgi:hypothetical protein